MTKNNLTDNQGSSKRILVAPLDWGLGHTTRCLPLIGWLRHRGHRPVIAGNHWQHSFIEKIFPGIDIINLEGYNITYGSGKSGSKMALLAQLPQLLGTIRRENEWLRDTAHELRLDGIISDNRYGLYHPNIPSVIMTHQLQVQTGLGQLSNRTLQKLHYKYLEKFDRIWVPDVAGTPNLAGVLSHTTPMPRGAEYLGLLSQFEGMEPAKVPGDYLLILLSGPEPQRTLLSEKLWKDALNHKGKVVFVAGSEAAPVPSDIPAHITFYPRIGGLPLAELMSGANVVICRSGYSTLMDLVLMHKKALIIPTPGQTEQEYLATHLAGDGIFPSVKQKDFDLINGLELVQNFPFHDSGFSGGFTGYRAVLDKWIGML